MRQRSILGLLLVSVLVLGESSARLWADQKAEPAGTWKWKTNIMGQEIETELKLNRDGEKLTGVIVGDDKEIKIEDGKFKDGEISFKALRMRSGQEFLAKYKGKLSEDTIKGKLTVDVGGEERSFDWEAKRVKEKKKEK